MSKKRAVPDFDEIFGDASLIPGVKKKKGNKNKSKADEEITSQIGEANMLYSESKFNEAVVLLLEITKKAPKLPDPYITLANIYNDNHNYTKALKFYLMGAQLDSKNLELWHTIAELAHQVKDHKQILYCFGKILKLTPDDLRVAFERCEIYEHLGDTNKAIEGYLTILRRNPDNVQSAEEAARLYHSQGKVDKAAAILREWVDYHLNRSEELLDLNIVNMLSELYNTQNNWRGTIKLIGITQKQHGDNMALDLVVKYGIAKIHMGETEEAKRCFERFLATELEDEEYETFLNAVDKYADLYLAIAEAYEMKDHPDEALIYYEKLASLDRYNDPVTWMKQAMCLVDAGNLPSAIHKYEEVLAFDPSQSDAVIALAALYKKTNQQEKAAELVNKHISSKVLSSSGPQVLARFMYSKPGDLTILLQKGFEEFEKGDYEAFVNTVLPMATDASLRNGTTKKQIKERSVGQSRRKKGRRRRVDQEEDSTIISSLTLNVYYLFLWRLGAAMDWIGKTSEGVDILQDHMVYIQGLEAYSFTFEQAVNLNWLISQITQKIGYYDGTAYHLRQVAKLKPESSICWNEFTRISTNRRDMNTDPNLEQSRHNRFLKRYAESHSDSVSIMLASAHQFQASGFLKHALRAYLAVFSIDSDLPIVALSIGVCYLSTAMSRTTEDRNSCVVHAFAFFSHYRKLSNSSPESAYNLARAYHQVSLFQMAIPLYEEVLASESELKREAAFNLSRIYFDSGSHALARKVLHENIVI